MPIMNTILVQDGGLTLRGILASVPHDPAAVIAYLLVAGFIGAIWWGNRRSSGDTPTGPRGASMAAPGHTERDGPGDVR